MRNCRNSFKWFIGLSNYFLFRALFVSLFSILLNFYAEAQQTATFELFPTEITYVRINDGLIDPYYVTQYTSTVGYLQSEQANYKYRRGLLFDCGAIPSYATVTDATFHLFALACGGSQTGGIKITSINNNFTSQTAETVHGWIFSGNNLGSVSTPYGDKSINTSALKSAVQVGVQSSNHNIGIGAINTHEDSGGQLI